MRLYELLLEARADSLFAKYQAKILARHDHSLGNLDTTSGLEFVQRLESEFGRYVEWVLLRWLNSDFLNEDLPRVREAIDQFEAKKRGLEKKDINQYRSLSELEDAVGLLDDVKSNRQVKQEIKSDGIRKIFENDSYLIAELLTKSAACFYGKGTKWCTAAEKNNMFSHYQSRGPLYIVIDKGENRKYQLHYESTQFMNEKDRPVKYTALKKKYPAIEKIEKDSQDRMLTSRNAEALTQHASTFMNARWPEAESIIIDYPGVAFEYARDVIKGRWPEAEPTIMQDPQAASHYAQNIIRGRWPEAESAILKNPQSAYAYAYYVIGGPWSEAEPAIMQSPLYAYQYARYVIKGRWPEAEPVIMAQPDAAYGYARYVIKGRWPEAEPVIMQDMKYAYYYAKDVIKGRWPAAEPAIMQDMEYAYEYARHVIKGRWPAAEPTIMRYPTNACLYAIFVLKSRWPEAEPAIMKNKWLWDQYKEHFKL